MTRRLPLALLLCVGLLGAQEPGAAARGSAIFSEKCGIGYCHGKEGRAGRGPRLAGRKFDKDYLFRTVSEGVNNSLMPAFKGQLSTADIHAVVAYILSLSGAGLDSRPPTAEPPPPPSQPASGPRSSASDPNAGDPEAGRAIFYDASSARRCAACHQFQGRGSDAGPDLTSIAGRPAREILGDIIDPDARLSAEPVTVLIKSGQRFTGLKKQESRELVRIYDMGALPPVLRTIYKDQIESLAPERHSPMPGDYGRRLTRKQLLDLVAFLKSAPVALGDVE